MKENESESVSYVSDDDISHEANSVVSLNVETASPKIPVHITDTRNYDSSEYEVVSPEVATKNLEERRAQTANPEFEKVLVDIEQTAGRKITLDEFDKLCHKYAVVLCERDEFAKSKYCDNVQINPQTCELYYNLLKTNRSITTASEVAMRSYEATMISPITNLMEKQAALSPEAIEIKPGERVNIRHSGKVRIAEDQGGRVIVIDNKRDVGLLHMQKRKEWIDKNFKDQLVNGTSFDRPTEDEFE